MKLGFDPVTAAFQADNVGVALAPSSVCEHGNPAFALTFPGRWIGQAAGNQPPGPITVIVARCTATHMTGAFTAFLHAIEGGAAAAAFIDQAHDAHRDMADAMRQLHAQGRICCQAAYLTSGREHTCARTIGGKP
ncbi:hypothetical protein ACIP96_06440 [Streptomyces nigra]|uniref:hypothetical protein n=1 Tax=Streptomyces nigra TaxID=1827580 RepID=UPI00381D6561